MFRRTFVKSIIGLLTLPLSFAPETKKKIQDRLNNSNLIQKLLKERTDFTITCDDGDKFNIIRPHKKSVNYLEELNNHQLDTTRQNTARPKYKSLKDVGTQTNRWYKFRKNNV